MCPVVQDVEEFLKREPHFLSQLTKFKGNLELFRLWLAQKIEGVWPHGNPQTPLVAPKENKMHVQRHYCSFRLCLMSPEQKGSSKARWCQYQNIMC